MDIFKKKLGAKIKAVRKERGFSTQSDLAEALGTDQVTVGRWEAGIHFPNEEYLGKLLKVLKISRKDLFGEAPTSQTMQELIEVIQSQETVISDLKEALAQIPEDIFERLHDISSEDWDSFRGMKGWKKPVVAVSSKKRNTSS